MKIAVSSYVAIQVSLFVAWLVGLFNLSFMVALIPTFVAVALCAIMFLFLKLVEGFIDTDDDEFSDVLGLDDCAKVEDRKEEDTPYGQNQNQEGQHT